MTSQTALPGTTGINVSLAHGDCWEQNEGDCTVNILKNLITTIKLNEVRTLIGDLVNKVFGTTTDTRYRVHNHTNMGPRNDTFLGTCTEEHHQPKHIHQPTSLVKIVHDVREYVDSHTTFGSYSFNLVGTTVSIIPVVNLSYTTRLGTLEVINTDTLVLEKKSKAVEGKYQGSLTEFLTTKIQGGGAHVKSRFSANAEPSTSGLTPES
jgi:hypothetical protein